MSIEMQFTMLTTALDITIILVFYCIFKIDRLNDRIEKLEEQSK